MFNKIKATVNDIKAKVCFWVSKKMDRLSWKLGLEIIGMGLHGTNFSEKQITKIARNSKELLRLSEGFYKKGEQLKSKQIL